MVDWAKLIAAVQTFVTKMKDPAATIYDKLGAVLDLLVLVRPLLPHASNPQPHIVAASGGTFQMAMASAGPLDPVTIELCGKLGDGKLLEMFAKLLETLGPLVPLILPLFIQPKP